MNMKVESHKNSFSLKKKRDSYTNANSNNITQSYSKDKLDPKNISNNESGGDFIDSNSKLANYT